MLEHEDKEIDGIVFRYHPMMLKQSRLTFDGLAQRFGPAIAAAVEGLNEAQINADMEVTEIAGGLAASAAGLIRGFVGGLDGKYHASLADALAKHTEYRNDEGNFVPLAVDVREVMFGARLLTEVKLMGWCLSMQYADFLEPLRTGAVLATSLRGVTLSALGSQKASTGSSSGSPPATSSATA